MGMALDADDIDQNDERTTVQGTVNVSPTGTTNNKSKTATPFPNNDEETIDDHINWGIPENDDDIIQFLETVNLEEQPTEFLVALADRLRERRIKSYPDSDLHTMFKNKV